MLQVWTCIGVENLQFFTTFDGGWLPRSCNATGRMCTRITDIVTRFTMTDHLHPSLSSSTNTGNGNRLLLPLHSRPSLRSHSPGACNVAPCLSVLLFSLPLSLSLSLQFSCSLTDVLVQMHAPADSLEQLQAKIPDTHCMSGSRCGRRSPARSRHLLQRRRLRRCCEL